jgi:plastocyanin
MRDAVSRRTLLAVCAVALVGAACSSPVIGQVEFGSGKSFVPVVADSLDNVGVQPSIGLDSGGTPFVAYFGFPHVLKKGEIPVTRPVTAPFVPSVLMLSQKDQIFTRGAVAMADQPPTGVTIPFGPAELKSLSGIKPGNVNGTALAVDATGGLHVAFVTDTGLYYGKGGGTTPFDVQAVAELPKKLTTAGIVGAPAIAVDDQGLPWIAWAMQNGTKQSIDVASFNGKNRFVTQTVAQIKASGAEPPPQRVAIGMTSEGPMVAYADTSAGEPMAAVLATGGKGWVAKPIEPRGGGFGLAMAVDKNGTPTVTYLTDQGAEVHVATQRGGRWTVTTVAQRSRTPGTPTSVTSVAVDDQGVHYAAYVDDSKRQVVLTSDGSGKWAALDTHATNEGVQPTLAVTPDGSKLFLAWYDTVSQDLDMGTFAETSELAVANPSPTMAVATTSSSAPGGGGCTPKGSTASVEAPVGAASSGFKETCLAVQSRKPWTVTFSNQDSGVPHNWALFQDQGYTKSIVVGDTITGPAKESIKGDALDAGTYYFRCNIHPTTMTGTFVVK